MMTRLITVILALGILPSFTAVSSHFGLSIPIHIIKLALPALVYFLWKNQKKLPQKTQIWFLSTLIFGTLSTLVACTVCGSLPSFMLREWAATVTGLIAAYCFLCLNPSSAHKILITWTLILVFAILLDIFAPQTLSWLLQNVFDPHTRDLDLVELKRYVLSGVWGRQSLAKLLAWIPWLLLFYALMTKRKKIILTTFIIGIFSTSIILATTQRGPFIASITGWSVFALHQTLQIKNTKSAATAISSILLSFMIATILVPRDIFKSRIQSLFSSQTSTHLEKVAEMNKNTRISIYRFSLQTIGSHPFGKPCISDEEYARAGLFPNAHAHNLFLQQFRDRGWLWGIFHLALWFIAWLGAWRAKESQSSALVAGITSILVTGLFDHPWFVIHHAIILGIFLLLGLNMLHAEKISPKLFEK